MGEIYILGPMPTWHSGNFCALYQKDIIYEAELPAIKPHSKQKCIFFNNQYVKVD